MPETLVPTDAREAIGASLFRLPWPPGEVLSGSGASGGVDAASLGIGDRQLASSADAHLGALLPLLRTLRLCGYRPEIVIIHSSHVAPSGWAMALYPGDGRYEMVDVADYPVPAGSGCSVEVTCVPEFHARDLEDLVGWPDEPDDPVSWVPSDLSLAVDLGNPTATGLSFDLSTDAVGTAGFTATNDAVDEAQIVAHLGDPIEAFIGHALDLLAAVWSAAFPLAPYGNGLCFLFDPHNWFSPNKQHPTGEHRRAARSLERVGSKALPDQDTQSAVRDFLESQVRGEGRVAEELSGWFPEARAKNLRHRVSRLMGYVSPGPSPDRVESWASAPWFDLIIEWIRWGAIEPPAVSSPIESVSGVEEEFGEFVTSTLTADRTELTLRIDGPDAVVASMLYTPDGLVIEDVVTWELVQREDDKSILIVVASPGVQLSIPQGPNPWWDWEIIRVQDHALVPRWGDPIVVGAILAPFPIALEPRPPNPLPAAQAAPPGFDPDETEPTAGDPMVMVTPHATGCRLEYPVYENGQRPGPPMFVAELAVSATSAVDRYAFDALLGLSVGSITVMPGEDVALDRRVIFSFWLSSASLLKATWDTFNWIFTQFEWRHVPVGTDLPRFGARLPTSLLGTSFGVPTGTELPNGEISSDYTLLTSDMWPDHMIDLANSLTIGNLSDIEHEVSGEWAQMVADFAVGFLPVVGDLADIAEFGWAMYSGTDRWGRPVTYFDLAVMGACAALPIANSGLVRGAGRQLTNAFSAGGTTWSTYGKWLWGPHPRLADDAFEAAREAGRNRLADLSDAQKLDVYRVLRQALSEATEDFAARLSNEPLDLADLLTDQDEFWIGPLQWSYRRWKTANEGRLDDLSPLAYWEASRGRPKAMLQCLLGETPTEQLVRQRKNLRNGKKFSRIPTTTRSGGVGASAMASRTSEILDAVPANRRADVQVLLERANGGSLSPMTEASMRKLMGGQQLHPDELAGRLAGALDIAADEALAAARVVNDPDRAGDIFSQLIRVDGFDGYIQDLVTLSGKGEHGPAAEVYVLSKMIADGEPFRFQQWINGLKGPDVVRFVGPDLVPQIVQIKAFKNLKNLTGASRHAEIYRQMTSDLGRVMDSLGDFSLPNGAIPPVDVPVDGNIVFKIDRDHLYLYSKKSDDDFYADLDGELQALTDQLNQFLADADLGRPFTVTVEAFSRSGL